MPKKHIIRLSVAGIPPEVDADFVAHMNQVLETYQRPYDPYHPVICMNEKPVQLVRETRSSIDANAKPGYEPGSTVVVFLFTEPLAGWRQATARPNRTKIDWAQEVAALLEGRYAQCDQVSLVCNHLNTHTRKAFYYAYEPLRAWAIAHRVKFCRTPKYGSSLNIANNELRALTRQCLRRRRIDDLATLQSEIAAWSTDVNRRQHGLDWQINVDDTRRKLAYIYP